MTDNTATPTIRAIFARKPGSLEDACFGGKPMPIEIQATRELTADEYDALTDNLSATRTWLKGTGGGRNGRELVIEVTAPDRKTLYINAEGSDWPRYVGIAW
jgi:hypothetical protein